MSADRRGFVNVNRAVAREHTVLSEDPNDREREDRARTEREHAPEGVRYVLGLVRVRAAEWTRARLSRLLRVRRLIVFSPSTALTGALAKALQARAKVGPMGVYQQSPAASCDATHNGVIIPVTPDIGSGSVLGPRGLDTLGE